MSYFNKRGQAALEFLSTYGWAFLVILVMIGALGYFGVLDPSQYVTDSCKGSGIVECGGGYAILSNDTSTSGYAELQLDILNNNQESIIIKSIDAKEKTDTDYQTNNIADVVIPAYGRKQVNGTFGEYFDTWMGSKKTFNFIIYYSKGDSAISNTAKFTITTDVQ